MKVGYSQQANHPTVMLIDQDISHGAYRFYGFLSVNAGVRGVLTKTNRELSEESKMSVSTIKRYLKEMESAGYIAMEYRYSDSGQVLYRKIFLIFDGRKFSSDLDELGEVHPDPQSKNEPTPQVKNEPTQSKNEPDKINRGSNYLYNTPPTPQRGECVGDATEKPDSMEDLFELWWQNYPRKKSRKKAFAAFRKLKPSRETVERWISCVQAQANDLEQRKRRQGVEDWLHFFPYGSTWLNEARWEDEVEGTSSPPPREAAPRGLHYEIINGQEVLVSDE